MDDTLYLLITIARKEDMSLLRYGYVTSTNSVLGENYMYWNEDNISKIYAEIFDFDFDEVAILKVETIDRIKG